MSFLRRAQRDTYLASRALGDLDALCRGPDVLAKRVVRRTWHRAVLRSLPGWKWPR